MAEPRATAPYTTYRYRGSFGWIYIGAMDIPEALREADRSLSVGKPARAERLEVLTSGGNWQAVQERGSANGEPNN